MTTFWLYLLTHGVALFAGVIAGLAIARWAMDGDTNPDRFWNGH